MTKLNDLQLVLLSAAAQRDDGSLLPPPDHLADKAAGIRKTILALIKQGLVEEMPTNDPAKVWREQDDERFALVITEAGRSSIGVTVTQEQQAGAPNEPLPSPPPQAAATVSKTEQVLTMLRREEGASLEALVGATGWLPHSTRAALTGLRKKGHSIILDKSGERTCYRIVVQAPA